MPETKSIEQVREGDYVLLNGEPCLVEEVQSPEETGTSEYKLKGSGVLDNKEYEENFSSSDAVDVVNVTSEEHEVESVNDSAPSVTLKNGTEVPMVNAKDAAQLYQEIAEREDRSDNRSITTRVVTAQGRKVAFWA